MAFRPMTEDERYKTMLAAAQARAGSIILVPNGVDPEEVLQLYQSMRNPHQYEFGFLPTYPLRNADHVVCVRASIRKQTRRASAAESILNILIGFGIQYTALFIAMNAIGFAITPEQNFIVGVFMTIVSFARSYALRRLFEYLRVTGLLH